MKLLIVTLFLFAFIPVKAQDSYDYNNAPRTDVYNIHDNGKMFVEPQATQALNLLIHLWYVYEKEYADSILIGYEYEKKTSKSTSTSWRRYFEYYLAKEVDPGFADGMTWEKFIRYEKMQEDVNYDTKTPIYYHYPLTVEGFIKFLDKKIRLIPGRRN